jgi:hypothetical protein
VTNDAVKGIALECSWIIKVRRFRPGRVTSEKWLEIDIKTESRPCAGVFILRYCPVGRTLEVWPVTLTGLLWGTGSQTWCCPSRLSLSFRNWCSTFDRPFPLLAGLSTTAYFLI